MKKRRRVEIQIEHREFSMFAATGTRQMGQEGRVLEKSKPDTCPTCGATETLQRSEAGIVDAWNTATRQHDVESSEKLCRPSPRQETHSSIQPGTSKT